MTAYNFLLNALPQVSFPSLHHNWISYLAIFFSFYTPEEKKLNKTLNCPKVTPIYINLPRDNQLARGQQSDGVTSLISRVCVDCNRRRVWTHRRGDHKYTHPHRLLIIVRWIRAVSNSPSCIHDSWAVRKSWNPSPKKPALDKRLEKAWCKHLPSLGVFSKPIG